MVDIFDEVDEELRAEKAQKLLVRYSGVIAAAALAIVGAAGGWQGWQWWQARQDNQAAVTYLGLVTAAEASQSLDQAARIGLAGSFDGLAASAPEGYRTLSHLRSAALKADSGDLNGAAAIWDQVAGDSAGDPLLRDLATLTWAQRQIDRADPARLEARLKPLIEPGNVWRPLAREQLALLALRQGQLAAARTMFGELAADVTAPAGVRGRATALVGRLGE